MHNAGRKYAAYSFSTGNPNHLEIWKELEPGVMASDYLALHEYIYPGADYTKPDYSMCTRHQKVYAALSPAARAHVKMIITECGADLHGIPGADGGGYKKNIGDAKYWEWLREYDKILLEAPYVVGATIYTYGANRDWVTYDISGSFANLMMNRIPDLPDTPEPALPTLPPPPATGTTPAKPVTPPVPGLLLLAQVRGYVEQAIQHLEANEGDPAHDVLSKTVIPWFYASAREHSDNLPNAEAHTAARWHCEEATRRIEAKKFDEARDILRDQVLAWLLSPGPIEMGLLSVKPAPKAKPKTKANAKSKSLDTQKSRDAQKSRQTAD